MSDEGDIDKTMPSEQFASLLRALIYAVTAIVLSAIGGCAAFESYDEYMDTQFKIACVQAGKNYEVVDLIKDDDSVDEQEVCR